MGATARGATTRGARRPRAAAKPAAALPAFWLPAALRARLITSDTRWQEARFACGRECEADGPDDQTVGVAVRWPLFGDAEWGEVMSELRAAHERAPRGPEYWARLQTALGAVAGRLWDPAGSYRRTLLEALPRYTGYSPGMVSAVLGAPEVWNLENMEAALQFRPDKVCGARWRKMPGLPGRVRFFPSKPLDRVAGWTPVAWEMPLYRAEVRPGVVLAYPRGNIPGNALQTVILALSTTLHGRAPLPDSDPLLDPEQPPPAVLLGNPMEEPILAPLVLAAIEEVDPELVAMVAALVWDHGDDPLLGRLRGQADLVMAAGRRKAGFSAIGREMLGEETVDIVALLAGLDSAFWDQNSGLSSRVHFVESGGPADDMPAEYARRLTARLRQISQVMPRGAWPVHQLHDAFDHYNAMEGSDRWGTGLRVISDYDDPFVVALDERMGKESRLDMSGFASLVDECQTRVVVVRPVEDLMEVPWHYLGMMPPHSLQSLGVAVGRPGEGLTRRFLEFAAACGKQGVTTIRTVGKGAFPQPAYSSDGLLPLDLVGRRPPGYFTTIEFDSPFEEIMETYRAQLRRLAAQIPADGARPGGRRPGAGRAAP